MPVKRKVKLFKLAGCAFFVIFALLYSHVEVGMSGNESGRFATIQAIAEQGVFHIEKCNFRTVDRTVRNDHVYYDKLPLLPLCLAGVYAPLHKSFGINFVDNYHLSIYLINLLLGAVVNVLLFLWIFDLLRGIKKGKIELKFLLAMGCVGGSWIISYSTMLNNHTPAALAVLGIFTALMRYNKVPTLLAAFLAGFSAGIVGLLEAPCGLFFGIAALTGIFFSAPRDKRLLHTASAAGAGALCLLFGMFINWYAYGTVLPLYMAGSGGKGTYTPTMHSDLFYYCYHALLGDRGIFAYTPFLLLGLLYCVKHFKYLCPSERALALGGLGFMLFYLLCTNEFGGQSYGLRYFIPVIPLLWYWGGKMVLELPDRKWKAPFLGVLIFWGVVTGLAGAYHPFSIGNEGVRSPEGHFSRNFSSFGGNLLCWSYEYFPESSLTQRLFARYGLSDCVQYLYWSYFHQKKIEQLKKMQQDFPGLYPGRKIQNTP